VCASTAYAAGPVDKDLVIWDNKPANRRAWQDTYPVGNGRLGAMTYGTFPQEKILLNEETIWARSADARFAMPKDARKHMAKAVELDAQGKFRELHDYWKKSMHINVGPDSYQLFGWLFIEYMDARMKGMYRSLDLKTGIARNVYTLEDGTTITQRVFASAPDDVIVVHITSDKDLQLKLSLKDMRHKSVPGSVKASSSEIVFDSAADGEGATKFLGVIRVVGGDKVSADGDALVISGTKEITLHVAISTDFNYRDSSKKLPDGWKQKARDTLARLKGKTVAALETAAVADHKKYFDRVSMDFGSTSANILEKPTRERLGRIKKEKVHDDPDLMEAYVQFGRYLMIGSSRPGTFPSNLQGIWNPHVRAPWGSDFHLNINIQMNYWPAETMNLGELHQPLFDLIRYFQPNGKGMADIMGMKGWCMGHATDLWAHARIMAREPWWGSSLFGGQWMTFHMLEHYRFNRDKQFLADHWDLLTSSVEFVDSWLIPHPKHKEQLVSRPTASPENKFRVKGQRGAMAMSSGCSFDQFMILQCFRDYVEAAQVLGKTDDPLVQRVKAKIPKIYMPRIGEDGRLLEWREPFIEAHKGHRHISHVIGAYPGNVIDLDDDPIMRDAVMKSIEGRLKAGGAGTGWSRAWTIGMFARLSDKARAYENFHTILVKSTTDGLWDWHGPLQIDGNFGATAAVAEFFLHSHNDELKLLPALPKQWPNGHINGLRARGDYTVDVSWEDGKLDTAVIRAGKNTLGTIPVVYEGKRVKVPLSAGKMVTVTAKDFK
jgi:alpha-L-fucosidase 2